MSQYHYLNNVLQKYVPQKKFISFTPTYGISNVVPYSGSAVPHRMNVGFVALYSNIPIRAQPEPFLILSQNPLLFGLTIY